DVDIGVASAAPARSRYAVGGAMVIVGIIAALIIGKALTARRARPTSRVDAPVTMGEAPKPPTQPVVTAVAAPSFAPPAAAPSAAAPRDANKSAPDGEQRADEAEAGTTTPAATAEPSRPKAARKASDPPGSEETLKRRTLNLLNRGALSEAIPVARE